MKRAPPIPILLVLLPGPKTDGRGLRVGEGDTGEVAPPHILVLPAGSKSGGGGWPQSTRGESNHIPFLLPGSKTGLQSHFVPQLGALRAGQEHLGATK